MRLLICGDRRYDHFRSVMQAVSSCDQRIETIISGHALGADRLGERAAQECCIPYMVFPANWDCYKRAAGPIRNQQMIDEGYPDEVWAFHDNLSESKGTKDMIRRALKHRIPVVHYRSDGFSACIIQI